jgi:hypothetical protein
VFEFLHPDNSIQVPEHLFCITVNSQYQFTKKTIMKNLNANQAENIIGGFFCSINNQLPANPPVPLRPECFPSWCEFVNAVSNGNSIFTVCPL